jgi:hypothetical protein
MFMLYMFRPHGHPQATHLFKESTALCTLLVVLLKYVIIFINFGVIGCLFLLSYVLQPLCAPFGVCCLGHVYLVLICIPCTRYCKVMCPSLCSVNNCGTNWMIIT